MKQDGRVLPRGEIWVIHLHHLYNSKQTKPVFGRNNLILFFQEFFSYSKKEKKEKRISERVPPTERTLSRCADVSSSCCHSRRKNKTTTTTRTEKRSARSAQCDEEITLPRLYIMRIKPWLFLLNVIIHIILFSFPLGFQEKCRPRDPTTTTSPTEKRFVGGRNPRSRLVPDCSTFKC